jgi:hypothetical protein
MCVACRHKHAQAGTDPCYHCAAVVHAPSLLYTQQPLIPTILQSIGVALWLIVMIFCFYFVRRVSLQSSHMLCGSRAMFRVAVP